MDAINPYRQQIKQLDDVANFSKYASAAVDILRAEMRYDAGHDEGHIVRVVRNALWFGEGGDQDVIIPAAILHDLVNLPKDSLDRKQASKMSATKALECMYLKCGFKDKTHLKMISNAIEAHSWSANINPSSREAEAVQDADRIEALGHIGIARLFAVGGSMGRALFHPTDPLGNHRRFDEYAYTLDHYFIKLINLPLTMKTPLGSAVANLLTLKMKTFIQELINEL